MEIYNYHNVAEMSKTIKVLYVEDNYEIRTSTLEVLENFFDDIIIALDGQDGINKFEKFDVDLVITDIVMPKLDGLELAKYIKSKKPSTPILITTAFSESKYFIEAIKIGVEGYILKPIAFDKLLDQIEKVSKLITLKKENEVLQNTLSQYKSVVDESIIVSKTDPFGVITYVNEMFCKASKYTKEELIGHQHNIIRHPDMPKKAFADLWHTIRDKKQTWKGKIKNRSKDGTTYIVQSTVMPILDKNGEIVEFIALRDDITEIENLKEAIKNQRDDISNKLSEYSNAIDNATIVSRTNLDGIITYANDRFSDVSGYTKEELVGSPHNIVKHPDTRATTFKSMWDTIKCGKIWHGVLKNRRKSGESYWVKSSIFPIFDRDGKITEFMSIRQDITKTITLHMELEDTQKELLYRMGDIAERRSEETGMHVKRVAEYSKLLALKYGLSEEESYMLYLASPMHDIGKVAISDDILKKPAKLTDEEFETMKTHSAIGYELLNGSSRPIMRTAAIVAKEHHERWNGTGYPEGKSGNDIHIYGRITAVADVFDALGSDRYYKKAWHIDEILEYLREEKGKHFDPNLIDIFFTNLDEFLEIKAKYQDK